MLLTLSFHSLDLSGETEITEWDPRKLPFARWPRPLLLGPGGDADSPFKWFPEATVFQENTNEDEDENSDNDLDEDEAGSEGEDVETNESWMLPMEDVKPERSPNSARPSEAGRPSPVDTAGQVRHAFGVHVPAVTEDNGHRLRILLDLQQRAMELPIGADTIDDVLRLREDIFVAVDAEVNRIEATDLVRTLHEEFRKKRN